MLPENVTATQTPNLCNLIGCPGAVAPDATARATVYDEARAGMVSQTNANHTQMLTGAPGARERHRRQQLLRPRERPPRSRWSGRR